MSMPPGNARVHDQQTVIWNESAIGGKGIVKEKMRNYLCQMLNAAIIAGIILLFIGLYYSIIKAGIPYQDPPLDLWIQYEVDARIGDILIGNGFKIAICGSIIRVVLNLIWKKKWRMKQ